MLSPNRRLPQACSGKLARLRRRSPPRVRSRRRKPTALRDCFGPEAANLRARPRLVLWTQACPGAPVPFFADYLRPGGPAGAVSSRIVFFVAERACGGKRPVVGRAPYSRRSCQGEPRWWRAAWGRPQSHTVVNREPSARPSAGFLKKPYALNSPSSTWRNGAVFGFSKWAEAAGSSWPGFEL